MLENDFNLVLMDDLQKLISYGSKDGYSDILLLIGPDKELNTTEIMYIRKFLDRGGAILVADETGRINKLISSLYGAEISVDKYSEYAATIERNDTSYVWMANMTFPYSYFVDIDLPSYLSGLGVLKSAGYYIEISLENGRHVKGGKVDNFAGYYDGEHRAFVVADTSFFINEYIGDNRRYNYIVSVLMWLSTGKVRVSSSEYSNVKKEVSVLVDNSHYEIKSTSFPLPHIGMIMANYLSNYGEEFNRYTYDYIINAPPSAKFFMILLLGLSIYRSSRRWYEKKVESDTPVKMSRERRVIMYSPELENIRLNIRRRGIYKRMIANLYEMTDLILMKKVGTSIESLIIENRGWDLLSVYVPDGTEKERLYKTLKELHRVRQYLEGNRRFIFIFRWRWKFYQLADNLNILFARLGVPLIGEKIGKGIEYWFR
jgi:hypothetical protein